jgi:protein TonB
LLCASGVVLACAAAEGPLASADPPPVSLEPEPPAVEDAVPPTYAETEVDVPARPSAPIRAVYPSPLRSVGIEGDVEARVVVLADGAFGGARLVESSHPGFTDAARDALRGARFEPAQLDGRAVNSWVTVRLRFRLE